MGLYDTISTEIATAMEADLSDAVVDFTFTVFTTTSYDIDLGAPIETEATKIIRGFVVKYVVGEMIDVAPVKDIATLLIMSSDATIDFEVDMQVNFYGKDFKISGVSRDPVKATWKLQCRGI